MSKAQSITKCGWVVYPEIKIQFEQTAEGYNFVVRDNGIGISAEVLNSIFEHGYCCGIFDRFSNIGNGMGLVR